MEKIDKKSAEEQTETKQIITFYMNNQIYAFTILHVKEIIAVKEIEQVPNTPDFLEGVYSLRGEVIPIIDLRKRFKLPIVQKNDGGGQNKKEKKVIITNIDGLKTGFIIDELLQVMNYSHNDIQPPPAALGNIHQKYITGVIRQNDQLIILLDINLILSFEVNSERIA